MPKWAFFFGLISCLPHKKYSVSIGHLVMVLQFNWSVTNCRIAFRQAQRDQEVCLLKVSAKLWQSGARAIRKTIELRQGFRRPTRSA